MMLPFSGRRRALLLLTIFIPAIFAQKAPRTGDLPFYWYTCCIADKVPMHFRNSTTYAKRVKLNFRNDHATPKVIMLPTTEQQVRRVVKCAHYTKQTICTRSGGHSFMGKSLCDGILLDMGVMRKIRFLNSRHDVDVQSGLSIGEILWHLWSERRRWFASGVCPGVGITGYMLGGGHGPYEGKLGMACDSLISVRMVNRFGRLVVASRRRRRRLFWALCGSGGGQFGVVTSFRMRTYSSEMYDKSVVFRFHWPHEVIGDLMEKWQTFDEDGGTVWFRLKMFKGSARTGIDGFGACYGTIDKSECMARLNRSEIMQVPGREMEYMNMTDYAPMVHAFFSADGNFGRMLAPDAKKSLTDMRYDGTGSGNDRLYKSTFLTFDAQRDPPSSAFWQRFANFCADPGRASIPWIVCELNLFNNAINRRRNNAFAHRRANVITHYIIGGGEEEDKLFAYRGMESVLMDYTTGVYVNYPELLLSKEDYPQMYWGESLRGLQKVKRRYDPDNFFFNTQPIPL